MKRQLIIITSLFFSVLGFSQGIVFEHGTWKEIIEKAKQNNKSIFIDVYTSWCGPCKKMSKDIFPLTEVGKVYNENFICYQLDGEKGDGIQIVNKYGVRVYPTYLFIKADGTLYYKASGTMSAKDFIALSIKALTEINDPKPIAVWNKEYLEKKGDPKFILDYMTKRSMLGMSTVSLFDEYLKLIPDEERTSATAIELYKKEGNYLKVNSLAYKNLLKNKNTFVGKLFGYTHIYLLAGVMNTMRDAATSKNELLLAAAIDAYDQLPEISSLKQKDEIYMEYYRRTGDTNNYFRYAKDFCNNQLMKISKDSIEKKDKLAIQQIEKQFIADVFAKIDSTQLAHLKEFSAHAERNRIGESLNNIAWEVFQQVSDKDLLSNALSWSKRSLELSPKNPSWLDTYANLLYKLGQKQEAISVEEQALCFADKKNIKGLEDTLRKIKANEKTWEN